MRRLLGLRPVRLPRLRSSDHDAASRRRQSASIVTRVASPAARASDRATRPPSPLPPSDHRAPGRRPPPASAGRDRRAAAARGPAYSCTIVNVGLETPVGIAAEPLGEAAHERGLAGAERPVEQHDVAGAQLVAPRSRPASTVSASRVRACRSITIRRGRAAPALAVRSQHRVAESVDDVAGDQRDLALVGLRQIAGEAVQVDGEPRGRVGVEQLRRTTRRSSPVSTSPVPPVAMPGIAGQVDARSRPSGDATSVRCPFSTTCTRCVVANSRATSSRCACTSRPTARSGAPSRPGAA